jgi:hypothetical protein
MTDKPLHCLEADMKSAKDDAPTDSCTFLNQPRAAAAAGFYI